MFVNNSQSLQKISKQNLIILENGITTTVVAQFQC
jgi:hypothetical protein